MHVVSHRHRERLRETEQLKIVLKLTKEKKIVRCVALREKRKCDFSFTQDTQGR